MALNLDDYKLPEASTTPQGGGIDLAKYKLPTTTPPAVHSGGSFLDNFNIGGVVPLGGMIKSAAQPFLKTAVTLGKGAAGLLGLGTYGVGKATGNKTIESVGSEALANAASPAPVDFGPLGKAAPVHSTKEAIGTGLEIGSYFLGGEGAAQGARDIATQGILKSAGRGAISGSIAGGTAGAGAELQRPDSNTNSVITSAATGGILGAGIGGAAEGGASLVQRLRGNVPPNIAKEAEVQLQSDYEKWAGATKSGSKNLAKVESKTEGLNKAGTTGKPPAQILAEAHIVPETEDGKFETSKQAAQFLESLKPLHDANKKALEEISHSTPPPRIDTMEQAAVSRVNGMSIPAGDKKALSADIKEEFSLLRDKYGDTIPLPVLGEEKPAYWHGTKFDSTKPFKSDAYYQVGKSMQQAIENTARAGGFEHVAQLNREIGDRLEAAKLLQSLQGQTLKYGKLGRYAMMGIGSSLGHTLPGKVAGALAGDTVAQVLMDASVSNPVKRMILDSIQTEDPAAYAAITKWLGEQDAARATRPLLPAPDASRPITMRPPAIIDKGVPQSVTPSAPLALPTGRLDPNAIPLGPGRKTVIDPQAPIRYSRINE